MAEEAVDPRLVLDRFPCSSHSNGLPSCLSHLK